ncbi:hypothetical protein RHMOL_Rhmol11G0278700 [Rhododendron molle]|uniref:Uncharacterized protein n=1 Tax=Rhododendron molle TaxID=49168 RepID=A0ACC0LXY7_RHOML|nr:hypothetical protein RHMOL_Rhmol11G0278700 [Rhododendron molle]
MFFFISIIFINIRIQKSRRKASHVWKSIFKTKDFVVNNLKWLVGDGKDISFWHDWWCGNSILADSHVNITSDHLKVVDFITSSKDWNCTLLNQVINANSLSDITNVLIPRRAIIKDTPCWTLSSKGNFSVKSAYVAISDNPPLSTSWKWIWTLKIPAKLKGFLWICMHGKLLTNHHRMIRGLVDNDICPCCNNAREDLKHLFFECTTRANVWNHLPSVQVPQTNNLEEWRNWLHTNINHSSAQSGGYLTKVLTLVTLWKIWLARNRKVFDNIMINPAEISISSSIFASQICHSFLSISCINPRLVRLVSWNFPGTGKLKLNTDRSSRGNPGLEDCTSLEAELWGLFRGLELIQSQGMEAMEVESDSTAAIALINGDPPVHSPHTVIIRECKALMAAMGCTLNHTLREGNKVADKLANLGVEQEEKMVSHISPPDDIIPLLEADMRRVIFERV